MSVIVARYHTCTMVETRIVYRVLYYIDLQGKARDDLIFPLSASICAMVYGLDPKGPAPKFKFGVFYNSKVPRKHVYQPLLPSPFELKHRCCLTDCGIVHGHVHNSDCVRVPMDRWASQYERRCATQDAYSHSKKCVLRDAIVQRVCPSPTAILPEL